jgi:hypothetical protein
MTSESGKARFHLNGKTVPYAVCSCHCTYALTYGPGLTTPVYPERCMHRPTPTTICGEALLVGTDGELWPRKTFLYHDFKDYLFSLLSRRDIEAMMDQACDDLMDSINSVTRTPASGVAPIHFPSRPRFLPIPGRLRAHTHAIPILADRTLPLPLLVIFPLIAFLLTCTIFAPRIPSSHPLCPFHLTGTHPIISWTPYLTIGPRRHHPLPLPNPRLMTRSPVTATIASVCDSVPLCPYLTTGLWLIPLSTYLSLYYYLQPGLCSVSLRI